MTLWLVFSLIAAFFLLVLVIAVVFDGVLDMFDVGGDGVLSLTSIGGAGTGFGAFGALSVSVLDADIGFSVMAGLVGAVALGWVSIKVASMIRSLEQEPSDPNSKVGETGHALNHAKAGEPFEFSFVHNGMRKKKFAIADKDVETGERLEVEAILSSSRLKVREVSPDNLLEQ